MKTFTESVYRPNNSVFSYDVQSGASRIIRPPPMQQSIDITCRPAGPTAANPQQTGTDRLTDTVPLHIDSVPHSDKNCKNDRMAWLCCDLLKSSVIDDSEMYCRNFAHFT